MNMSNKVDSFDLTLIDNLKECKSYEDANEHLNLGWVLISTHITDYGHPVERHQNTNYCLGWPKTAGELKYPKSKQNDVNFF